MSILLCEKKEKSKSYLIIVHLENHRLQSLRKKEVFKLLNLAGLRGKH